MVNRYKICIVDDEIKAAEVLETLLHFYFENIQHILIITDPAEALARIPSFRPDLLFMDIKMPNISGLEVVNQIAPLSIPVIFVTAHDQHAIQALRLSAVDYLLKPIDEDDLIEALKRFTQRSSVTSTEHYQHAYANMQANRQEDLKISLNKGERTYFFDLHEVVRCEANSNYTLFYFRDGNKILSSKTLKEYYDILKSHGFIRIHKSHLVNIDYITSVVGNQHIELADQTLLPIARRRRTEVRQLLKTTSSTSFK